MWNTLPILPLILIQPVIVALEQWKLSARTSCCTCQTFQWAPIVLISPWTKNIFLSVDNFCICKQDRPWEPINGPDAKLITKYQQ